MDICVFAAIIMSVVLVRMLKKDYIKRKDFRNVNELIREFIEICEEHKDFLEKCDKKYEEGVEIYFENEFYELRNTKELRQYLDRFANKILSYEEMLKESYGEINYTEEYERFRTEIEKIRMYMLNSNENRDPQF